MTLIDPFTHTLARDLKMHIQRMNNRFELVFVISNRYVSHERRLLKKWGGLFLSSISFGCLSAKMSTAMYPSWVSCRAERWSCLLVFGRQVRELLCSCSYVNLSTDWRPRKYKDRPHRLHYLTQYIALYFMVMVSCAFLEWLNFWLNAAKLRKVQFYGRYENKQLWKLLPCFVLVLIEMEC